MKMKLSIVCLLLMALLGIIVSASIAQQNQNAPKADAEDEKLKIQLQTLENEKIELETKLAEANAKLINADFGKFERELRDSNNKWLWGWTTFFVAIVAIVVTVIGFALWFSIKSMISGKVEEHLKGFQEAFEQVNELKSELRALQKELVVSVLENLKNAPLSELERHPEQIKALSEEVLLEVFNDKTRDLEIRFTAVEVLAARKSPQLVSSVLTFINSVVDSDIDWGISRETNRYPYLFLSRLSKIYNEETYQGLKTFLNRLITENPKNMDLFLPWTASILARVSIDLDRKDVVSMIRKSVPDMNIHSHDVYALTNLVEYFNKFEEYEGIKEIYNFHAKGRMSDVEEKCLELLEKYDLDFVREQREEKETANTEGEESNESEPAE